MATTAIVGTKVLASPGVLLGVGNFSVNGVIFPVTNGIITSGASVVSNPNSTVIISNGGTTLLIVTGVNITGVTFNWDTFVLATGESASGVGVPSLACSVGSTYTQLDFNNLAWVGVAQNGIAIWEQAPGAQSAPPGIYSGMGAPAFPCIAPAVYTRADALAGQQLYALAAVEGTTSTNWVQQAQGAPGTNGAPGAPGSLTLGSPVVNDVVFHGSISGRSFQELTITKPYRNIIAGVDVYGEPAISSCIKPDGTLFGVTLASTTSGGTLPYTTDSTGALVVTKAIIAPNLPPTTLLGPNTRSLVSASVDVNGNLIAAVGPGGPFNVSFPVTTVTPVVAAVAYEPPDDAWIPLATKANLLYAAFVYGESLGSGADSTLGPNYNTGVTMTQPFANVGFSHDPTVGASGLAFVPLTQAANAPNAGNTETLANGLADRLSSLTQLSTLSALKVLVGNAAVPGYTYAQLKQGTGPYNELLNQVTQAKSLATAAGLVMPQPIIPFIHGYNDADAGQTTAQYFANIVTLQGNLQTDIGAITGLAAPVRFLLFQCGYNQTALAQTQLALTYPDLFRIVATSWQFQGAVQYQNALSGTSNSSANPLHLSPYDERFLGELAAECVKDILQARATPPFRLSSMTVQEKVITLGFSGNIGPVRSDTSHVVDPGNYGFELLDRRGTQITSVAITGPSTVTLKCDTYPTVGYATLGYAANLHNSMTGNPSWTGGCRGVLFDSRSSVSYYPLNGGAYYPLARALPMFTINF